MPIIPIAFWIILSICLGGTFIIMGVQIANFIQPLGWSVLVISSIFLASLILGSHKRILDLIDFLRNLWKERRGEKYYDTH